MTDSQPIATYRYEFTKPFCEILEHFARLHKYDDRKVFKEAWLAWTEENVVWIRKECDELQSSGYTGDSLDKMFKSARYYFRKKSVIAKDKSPRKAYIKVGADLLKEMDSYILEHFDMKPHDCYTQFCAEFDADLTDDMREHGEDKLKKTFKNRRSIIQKAVQTTK
jgi:hypothetical protein